MTNSQTAKHLTAEPPYQVVMIAAMLELLLLAALAPRSGGVAPLSFEVIAGLRLIALLVLGTMLGVGIGQRRSLLETSPEPVDPQPLRSKLQGALALALWGLILLPPELWAFALEARVGFPPTAVTSLMLGIGSFAALRVHARLGWAYPLLTVLLFAAQGFTLEPLSPALIVLGVGGLAILFWRQP
jgi:hypothetical protein